MSSMKASPAFFWMEFCHSCKIESMSEPFGERLVCYIFLEMVVPKYESLPEEEITVNKKYRHLYKIQLHWLMKLFHQTMQKVQILAHEAVHNHYWSPTRIIQHTTQHWSLKMFIFICIRSSQKRLLHKSEGWKNLNIYILCFFFLELFCTYIHILQHTLFLQ